MHIRETLSPQEFEHAPGRKRLLSYSPSVTISRCITARPAASRSRAGWRTGFTTDDDPAEDAAIMANCPDPHTRRKWVQRILDHDGSNGHDGGIEAWLQLGEAVGARET